MQTRNLLFSVVLCAVAQAGFAECERHPASAAASVPTDIQKVALADAAKSTGGPNKLGDMLIKNADAGQPLARLQPVSVHRQPVAEVRPDEDEGRPRATTAMLLTALAVMGAIALRRAGAED